MLNQAIQKEKLAPEVVDYINELETNYTQRIKELETDYTQRVKELETNHKQSYQQLYNEHLVLKEQYDLLVYKRFMRSAEQMLADEKQPLLFVEEAGQPEAKEEKAQEFETIKSFTRKKSGGRRPISANIERRKRIIDIPESEKTCACGAKLTRIGEETAD